jgi:hypothetical protein
VGGDSDRWAPAGSERKSGEEEVGRAGFVGRKRRWASGEKKEREESCWAGPRGEGERFRGLESFVFFPKLFKSFQTLNLNLF